MPLPKEHTYTIKDIYALPEGERAELRPFPNIVTRKTLRQ